MNTISITITLLLIVISSTVVYSRAKSKHKILGPKLPKSNKKVAGLVLALLIIDMPLLTTDLSNASSIFTTLGAFAHGITAPLALISPSPMFITPRAYAAVTQTLTTDKADYPPSSTVQITGNGFTPGKSYDIVVIRPDGSIVKSDGTLGFDNVVANATGGFVYLYNLIDGIVGLYTVNAYESSDTAHLNILASITFTDAKNKLVLIGGAGQILTAGQVSSVITVQQQDLSNAAVIAGAGGVKVDLSTNSPAGRFDTSAGGTFDGSVTSVTILQGSSSATFFYKDTLAGNPTLTASAKALTSVTTTFTINPAAASKLVFTAGVGQTLIAGTVSAQITVQRQDQFSNPVTTGSLVVNLASTSLTGKFDTSAGGTFDGSVTSVTIPQGSSSATFFYKDPTVGSYVLTASATGLTSATMPLTIVPSNPKTYTASITPTSSTTFGVDDPYTITINNPISNGAGPQIGCVQINIPSVFLSPRNPSITSVPAGKTWQAQLINSGSTLQINAVSGQDAGKLVSGESVSAQITVDNPPSFTGSFKWNTIATSNPQCLSVDFQISGNQPAVTMDPAPTVAIQATTTVSGTTTTASVTQQITSASATVTVQFQNQQADVSVPKTTIPVKTSGTFGLDFIFTPLKPSDVPDPITQISDVGTVPLYIIVQPKPGSIDVSSTNNVGTITIEFVTQKGKVNAATDSDGCPLFVLSVFNTDTGLWQQLPTSRDADDPLDTASPSKGGINCAYDAQSPHFSKFSVGGIKSPTSRSTGSGGYDANAIVDTTPPSIVAYNWKPDPASAGANVTIYADITDDVGVGKAVLFYYGPDEDARKAHAVSMKPLNNEWFTADVSGSAVSPPSFHFWIVTTDGSGNADKSDIKEVQVQQGVPIPPPPRTTTTLPANVLAAIKPKVETPTQKLEVVSMYSSNAITSFPDRIVIRNTGSMTADNIRIMLSPEIAHSFKLGTYTVGSIAPHSNVTISLQHIGNPNRDVYGGLTGYNGNVIVMGEHLTPILLPVIIDTDQYLQGHRFIMPKLSGMEQQKREVSMLSNGNVFSNGISLLNSMLKHPVKNSNYEVTTSSSKEDVITKPSGDIVIRNLSDKELKNIRIAISGAGNIFLVDNKVIHHLDAHGQVTIRMIPTINTNNYSPKDITGELLIVPSNDNPISIPINIPSVERKDSANEFGVSTMLGKDGIFTASDKVIIKNLGNRTMDSVKLMLSNNLARVATLSKDSFQHIEPNGAVNVEFKYNADLKTNANLKTFMQDYKGELIIASEHHNIRSIPISIEWKKVESNHFIIYSRSGDEQTAKQVKDFLETNYQKITSRFGKMDAKTVIYITQDKDEMKLVNLSGHPYYSYADDKIFVCKCDEPKFNSLKEFIYRLIINNYPSYYNMKKVMLDKENWLLDGISDYIAAKIYGHGIEKRQIDAFAADPAGFEWYGYGSDAEYGAAYTFLDYLTGKYGDKVIDKTLYYLGSGMVSNHRCSTLENCAVLRAVYNVNGLSMGKSYAHTIDVKTLVKEWEGYVVEHYGISELIAEERSSIAGQYDLSGLNTFQQSELMKALAKQSSGLTLTPTEKAVLDLVKIKN